MNLLPDPHKDKARRTKDAFENLRDWAGYMAVLTAPQNQRYSAMSASLAVASSWAARQAARVAEDPPRSDFDRDVERRKRRLYLDEMRDVPATEIGTVLIDRVETARADLSAMLIATERVSGALLVIEDEVSQHRAAQVRSLARERRREAYVYAGQAADDLLRGADASREFAAAHEGALASLLTTAPPRIAEVQYPLADELPDSVLAMLYRAGIPFSALRARVRLPGATGASYEAILDRTAAQLKAYGTYLREETASGMLLRASE